VRAVATHVADDQGKTAIGQELKIVEVSAEAEAVLTGPVECRRPVAADRLRYERSKALSSC